MTQYPPSPSHLRVLLIPFVLSFTFIRKLDGAIVATRYVYQLRGEKREARMPKHIRRQSDLGRRMPGFVRYTDASGATVYSSHSYQPMKGRAGVASTYAPANSDFDGWSDDTPSARLNDMENHEALVSEDEDREDDDYEDPGHEGRHPPGLHEAGLEDEQDDGHGHEALDQNILEGAFSISNGAERCT